MPIAAAIEARYTRDRRVQSPHERLAAGWALVCARAAMDDIEKIIVARSELMSLPLDLAALDAATDQYILKYGTPFFRARRIPRTYGSVSYQMFAREYE